MGVYMYAMHRTAKVVSGKRIVESKNHGKGSHGAFYDEYSPRTMAAIEKNADFFRNNPPDGFVLGKFYDGAPVFAFVAAHVYDSAPFQKIGTLVKTGRSFSFQGV